VSLKFGVSHSSICASAERFTTNVSDLIYRNENREKKERRKDKKLHAQLCNSKKKKPDFNMLHMTKVSL